MRAMIPLEPGWREAAGRHKRRRDVGACACVRASGCVASSVWAISRPLPGKHFLKEWDFSRGVVTQDGDHFLFADFVVAVAAFVDGLDDRFELFLRDHGLFSFGFGWGHRDQENPEI